MPEYSEQDLKYAAEFREEIHKEALAIVRKTRPDVTDVIDRHPVEDYFQEHRDYPGKLYTIVAIPYGFKSRKALVDTIVRDTLTGKAPEPEAPYTQMFRDMTKKELGRRKLTDQLSAKPDGYEELFVAEVDRKNGRFHAVGVDSEGRYILEQYEEYDTGSGTGSSGAYYVLTNLEYGRYATLALLNGQITEEEYFRLTLDRKKTADQDADPFYELLSGYPDLVVEYRILRDVRYCGYESHRSALKAAFAVLGMGWTGDPARASGRRIDAAELFSPEHQKGKLSYLKAFLDPPHKNSYTCNDFERVNSVLFPNGTDELEVYEWDTDWSDYFDDGREWWGTLCLTVYDRSVDRFAVIMASATD
jgi:hypothetical protein